MSEQNNNAGLGGSRNGGYDLKNRIQSDLDVNLLLRCSALDPRFKKLKFLNDKTDREDIFELLETELIDLVEQERNNNRQENINEGDGDSVRTEQLSQSKAKSITDHDVKQLLRILVKALESFTDITLIDAIVMCLTRLQPLLRPESPIHKALFWVVVSILQLDEISLYASDTIMLATRDPLEWHFKQLDHSVGLSFRANFHFALVGHLIKGYRHPSPATVTRTTRILSMLLSIIAKPHRRDKFEVTPNNVAHLAALVSVSEEVRSRCHVKHQIGDMNAAADSPLVDNFTVDNHLRMLSISGNSSPVQPGPNPVKDLRDLPVNQRQKSLEVMDQTAISAARMVRSPGTPGSGGSLRLKEMRSLSMPTSRPASQAGNVPLRPDADADISCGDESPRIETHSGVVSNVQERGSVSNENNILLDPDILTDHVTQVIMFFSIMK